MAVVLGIQGPDHRGRGQPEPGEEVLRAPAPLLLSEEQDLAQMCEFSFSEGLS